MSRSRFARALSLAFFSASSLCVGADCAHAMDVKLVEYAGTSAAFFVGDRLLIVTEGESVPETRAILRHVGDDEVQLEYPADADSPGAIVDVQRGAFVAAVAPRTMATEGALVPYITVLPGNQTDADREDSADGEPQ